MKICCSLTFNKSNNWIKKKKSMHPIEIILIGSLNKMKQTRKYNSKIGDNSFKDTSPKLDRNH